MKLHRLLLLASLLFAAGGCEQNSTALPQVWMKIGTRNFHIEVAKTPEVQEVGLMKRDSMPADHGMIFTFPDDDVREFWMKNTRIPLDIIFLNAGGSVVSIRQMQPYDLNLTSSIFPARYAIELNQGAAKAAGVKVGDAVDIPAAARSPNAAKK